METEKTNGQTNTKSPPQQVIETLDALLATAKNDIEKKEILGNVGQGIVRRINESQTRLAAAVLNGDLALAQQRYADIEEMNAFGWHLCKHKVAISGLAEKLASELVEALRRGVEIKPESPSSRHGVSFL